MLLATPLRDALQRYDLPRTLAAAKSVLGPLGGCARLYALFAHYFPDAWARHSGPERVEIAELGAAFYGLLDQQCFPIDAARLEWELEEQGVAWTDYVPIDPFALAVGDDGGFADARLGWQYLAVLAGCSLSAAASVADSPVLQALITSAREVAWGPFATACIAQGAPLAWVPDALEIVAGNTGNPWLDAPEEDPACWDDAYVQMTQATIDAAMADYRAAQTALQHVIPLLDYLEADPAHVEEVIALWNHHATTTLSLVPC